MYLKTLHLKIQRGKDDVIQVWIDPVFIMVHWEIPKKNNDRLNKHMVTNIISRQKVV